MVLMRQFDIKDDGWYNSYMKNIEDEIQAKIDTKRIAADKKRVKPASLANQIKMYERSIAAHQEKIDKLNEMILQRKESARIAQEEVDATDSDIKHMEEILARYRAGYKEREEVSRLMVERIDALAEWYPGIPDEKKRAWERDPEYLKAKERQEYLNELLPECITDVSRVYYSRGDVSKPNRKGRKGV